MQISEYNFIILGKSKLFKARYETFDYINIWNIFITKEIINKITKQMTGVDKMFAT